MSFIPHLAAFAAAMVSLAAAAQPKSAPPDPADPAAPVPLVSYQSAFRNTQPSSEHGDTPDKTWRAANDEMARLGGHAGHMAAGANDTARTSGGPTPASRGHGHH